MTIIKALYIVMILSISISAEAASTLIKDEAQPSQQSTPTNEELITYHLLQKTLQDNHIKTHNYTQSLETEIKIQAEKIKQLEKEIIRLDKPLDNGIATTVLSAASLIVTALGVLIAILSILGYRNIKKESMKDARRTARDVVKSITSNELPTATKEIIIDLLEKKAFDRIILNAVENVAYRGISIPDEMDEEKGL